MKRSSCLSALLVGLFSGMTLTTASVAFAAPLGASREQTAKPAMVAQNTGGYVTVLPSRIITATGRAEDLSARTARERGSDPNPEPLVSFCRLLALTPTYPADALVAEFLAGTVSYPRSPGTGDSADSGTRGDRW